MDYIKRYKELENNAKSTIISQDNKLIDKPMLIFNGFISKNTVIKTYGDQNIGFKLDDSQLYEDFLNKCGSNERNFSKDIDLIQTFIDEYFIGKENGVEEVKKDNPNIHSINRYKGKGGICIHKSTVANNLLQILGYDCNLICSNIGGENHAFIIIKNGEKNYVYDPSNKSKCYIDDNIYSKMKNYYKVPTLVEKSNEEIESFYNNQNDLKITEMDQLRKNSKQRPGIKIELPKLTYSCRNKTIFTDLNKNNVIDKYRNSLIDKGLTQEEIDSVFNKIKIDVNNGITPKVDTLNEIYEAFKEESNMKR